MVDADADEAVVGPDVVDAVWDRLADGILGEERARTDTAQATRRYARRQESWFRPDPRIVWIDATDADRHRVLEHALRAIREA